MKNKLLITLLLLSQSLFANSLKDKFPVGSGSNYKMEMAAGGGSIQVGIYVASNSSSTVNIEYFIESQAGLIPISMWQQFEIDLVAGFGAKIKTGYVKTKELPKPEIMTSEYLVGGSGVQVNDFLFNDPKALEKNKVGNETIQISAGETKSTHYRTSNNGQTIDYWISDEAKPIGLVKLTSKGKEANQNYSLELVGLMRNVKPMIDPRSAVSLTANGKSFLVKPGSVR
jgi:hypothetical protein